MPKRKRPARRGSRRALERASRTWVMANWIACDLQDREAEGFFGLNGRLRSEPMDVGVKVAIGLPVRAGALHLEPLGIMCRHS